MQLVEQDVTGALWKCISCRMTFNDLETQRKHYQTEFHAENSRRAAHGKPPMTQLEYQEYLNYVRDQQQHEQSKKQKKFICQACDKSFSSQAALQQHVQSNKHIAAVNALQKGKKDPIAQIFSLEKQKGAKQYVPTTTQATLPQIITEKDVEPPKFIYPAFLADEEKPIFDRLLPQLDELSDNSQDALLMTEIFNKRPLFELHQCLYCDFRSQEVENPEYDKNSTELPEDLTKHLDEVHWCVLPLPQFIPNKQKLYVEMQKEIAVGRSCIMCGKEFGTVQACQEHCNKLRHSVLHGEKFIQEFQEFYDFTSSYPEEFIKFIEEQGEMDDNLLQEMRKKRYIQPPNLSGMENPMKLIKQLQIEQGRLLIQLRQINRMITKLPQSKKYKEHAPQSQEKSTYIQLVEEKDNIINSINAIYKNSKDKKYLLYIEHDPNQYNTKIMPYQQQQHILEQNRRFQMEKSAVDGKLGQQITKFKRYFKRSTKVWLKCQK